MLIEVLTALPQLSPCPRDIFLHERFPLDETGAGE